MTSAHDQIDTADQPTVEIDLANIDPANIDPASTATSAGSGGTVAPGTTTTADVVRTPRPAAPAARRRPSARSREDVVILVGSALAALATTWLLYEKLLPLSGKVGFVIALYFVFVAYYAGVTALVAPKHIVIDRVMTTVVIAAPTLVAAALISMLAYAVYEGWAPLWHVNFYTSDDFGVRPTDPLSHGGILHAIVGTLIEVGIAVAIALPLGVTTAVFMSEIGGRGSRLVRTVIEAMTALPSIVAGLFIYSICIIDFHLPKSGFLAALALAVMGLPIMARTADVVLRVVPSGLREASYALGAGRWQTVWRVVLPTARPGLATALILGVARMVGETSPLLLTTGPSSIFTANPFHNPMNSLPLYIFSSVTAPDAGSQQRGYAAAVVLLALVLVLFLLARLAARGKRSSS